jgi:hypothetical protein
LSHLASAFCIGWLFFGIGSRFIDWASLCSWDDGCTPLIEMGYLELFFACWSWTTILPISASWVGRIAGSWLITLLYKFTCNECLYSELKRDTFPF